MRIGSYSCLHMCTLSNPRTHAWSCPWTQGTLMHIHGYTRVSIYSCTLTRAFPNALSTFLLIYRHRCTFAHYPGHGFQWPPGEGAVKARSLLDFTFLPPPPPPSLPAHIRWLTRTRIDVVRCCGRGKTKGRRERGHREHVALRLGRQVLFQILALG